MVQWLELSAFTAVAPGPIPGWRTKILQAAGMADTHVCMLSHFSHVRLCEPMDCGLPGSSVYGILQARILEWVAISSSRGSSLPTD